MRWIALALVLLCGCAETVRCPEGQVFDDRGACVPIADAGPGNSDGG